MGKKRKDKMIAAPVMEKVLSPTPPASISRASSDASDSPDESLTPSCPSVLILRVVPSHSCCLNLIAFGREALMERGGLVPSSPPRRVQHGVSAAGDSWRTEVDDGGSAERAGSSSLESKGGRNAVGMGNPVQAFAPFVAGDARDQDASWASMVDADELVRSDAGMPTLDVNANAGLVAPKGVLPGEMGVVLALVLLQKAKIDDGGGFGAPSPTQTQADAGIVLAEDMADDPDLDDAELNAMEEAFYPLADGAESENIGFPASKGVGGNIDCNAIPDLGALPSASAARSVVGVTNFWDGVVCAPTGRSSVVHQSGFRGGCNFTQATTSYAGGGSLSPDLC
ncbi:hypothetical protein KSP40_PGU005925 [Platanthera guangdongensis]|uniref:Uncharacterized protein n=1 Tax=Platanthera guangdongensis TaxID=2320717 RepID=A0ABR2M0U8_9ASPA